VTTFSATVLQNEYLPGGGTVVHAIVVVTAQNGQPTPALTGHLPLREEEGVVAGPEAVEVIMLDCSGSMGRPSSKIGAAYTATAKAIDKLRDGTWFAIVAGTSFARMVYPVPGAGSEGPSLARAAPATRAAAKEAIGRLRPGGGTAISHWLSMARRLFDTRPDAIHHALLLADGRNESEEAIDLDAELDRCRDRFQCDCRGVGTDWDRAELQHISDALLGTTDIIPYPWQMDDAFEAIMERSMGKQVDAVELQVLTPHHSDVHFLKQVSPEVVDMTAMAMLQQPVGPGGQWMPVGEVDPSRPLLSIYPTGAWADGEEREYHLCLSIPPQDIGEENELRAARVTVVMDGLAVTQVPVRAVWTHDNELTTRIDRAVAHYTGQEELAQAIEEGLEARRAGDYEAATHKLGRAAALAHETGNEATTRLLQRVVDIEDVERGTVRLRSDVTKEDEMTLDTRSRKTVRLIRSQAQ
jgi:von Willebrand factor type A C-terminal domain/von Willebrand factor type A domain